MIHVSDLFRPHNDPDDHWDLASVYSLAYQGELNLLGILIDHPQAGRGNDPDVLAVAQLNYLTGLAAPTMVGSPRWIEADRVREMGNQQPLRGVYAMLKLLEQSPKPVVINVLGSCRDVALAGKIAPRLFARKCAAIYLNAGSGTPDPVKAQNLEWNVHLDPHAYSAIFELPCPIYWMPCFEEVHRDPGETFQVREFGTFYGFRQSEIIPQLSESMQNFFAYVFLHAPGTSAPREPNWLRYLKGEPDAELLAKVNAMQRNMWCTAGFLHAAGKTVTEAGRIVDDGDAESPLFTFESIRVRCSDKGVTRWELGTDTPPRYLFRVRDQARYAKGMTRALRTLVTKLP